MAGRKPLPTHLKLVKGTARPHRMNTAEPKPKVAVPEPPDHLDEEAKAKFTAMAEMLARHGVMTELDTAALARYVVIWRRWLDAEAEVKIEPAIAFSAEKLPLQLVEIVFDNSPVGLGRQAAFLPGRHVEPARHLLGPLIKTQPADRILLRRHLLRLVDLALQVVELASNVWH